MLATLRIVVLLAFLVGAVLARENLRVKTWQQDDWALPGVDGHQHRLDEWRGQVVIVNFWATWCGNCEAEWPELNAAQQSWRDAGAQIIGVALDDEMATVQQFLEKYPANYPILHAANSGWLWSESLGNRERVLPFSVIFDRSGHAIFSQMGQFNREELQAIVRPLLR